MGKKAGAVKEKKGAKLAVKKVATDGSPDKIKLTPDVASQGKLHSLLRQTRKDNPQDKENGSSPSRPKSGQKLAVKGKGVPQKDARSSKPQGTKPKEKRQMFKESTRFFQSVWGELKKVHWLNRKETTVYTAVVIGSVVFVSLLIWVADSVLSQLLGLVLK
jgi:preprotein translocase subunit SecE